MLSKLTFPHHLWLLKSRRTFAYHFMRGAALVKAPPAIAALNNAIDGNEAKTDVILRESAGTEFSFQALRAKGTDRVEERNLSKRPKRF